MHPSVDVDCGINEYLNWMMNSIITCTLWYTMHLFQLHPYFTFLRVYFNRTNSNRTERFGREQNQMEVEFVSTPEFMFLELEYLSRDCV
ncbi:hypothetical protein PP707_00170 [Acetobacter pasteurianus]|nr:hypothetical protein [Acetobacter pasteurianus]